MFFENFFTHFSSFSKLCVRLRITSDGSAVGVVAVLTSLSGTSIKNKHTIFLKFKFLAINWRLTSFNYTFRLCSNAGR